MNALQLLHQLRTLIRAATWPGGAVVFNPESVRITRDVSEEMLDEIIWPACFLAPGGFQADPEHDETHRLVRRDIVVRMVGASAHDRFGETALIGSRDMSGAEGSGAGVLQLEEKLLDAIAELGPVNGVHVAVALASGVAPQFDGRGNYLATIEYVLSAELTLTRSYVPPGSFSAVRSGGNVTMTWTQPPSRYDLLGVALRKAAGSTPPATIVSGTDVGVALAATGVVDASSNPTSYSLFGVYDSDGDGVADAWSSPRQVTV